MHAFVNAKLRKSSCDAVRPRNETRNMMKVSALQLRSLL